MLSIMGEQRKPTKVLSWGLRFVGVSYEAIARLGIDCVQA